MFDPEEYSKHKQVSIIENTYIFDNYFHLLKLRPDGNDRILDIGCGDGEISKEVILKKFPSKRETLVATDKSNLMLDYASKKYGNDKRMTFRQLDIETTSLPQDMIGNFDHAIMAFVLHWLPNQEQSLKNIYDVLKPGGDTIIIVLAKHYICELCTEMPKSKDKWSKYITDDIKKICLYQHDENPGDRLENLLKNAGFSVTELKWYDKKATTDIDRLRKTCELNPFLNNNVPQSEWSEFLEDSMTYCRDKNLYETNPGTGEIIFPYRILMAVARKPE